MAKRTIANIFKGNPPIPPKHTIGTAQPSVTARAVEAALKKMGRGKR